MPRKTIALIASLFLITVVLLFAALKPSSPTQVANDEKHISPTIVSPAATELFLSPNPAQLTSTGGTVDVLINTNTNEINAVQLELQYDPKVLRNVKVSTGDFLSNPVTLINSNDTKSGKFTYAFGLAPSQKSVSGKGTVAHITFSKVVGTTAKETTLQLDSSSLVTSSGIDKSVLKTATGTKVVLQ